MLFSPEKTAIAGILLWGLLFLLAPLNVSVPVEPGAFLFILGCYFAFFTGCALSARFVERRQKAGAVRVTRTVFWGVLVVGLFGIAVRFYDRTINRAADVSLTAVERREALVEFEAGPLSVIGGALMPFCYLPLILLLGARVAGAKSVNWPLAIIAFTLPILEALSLLSRASMLVAGSMGFFAIACARFEGRPFNAKLLIGAVTAALAGAVASSQIFAARLRQVGAELGVSVSNSNYAFTLRPTREVLQAIQNPVEPLSGLYAAIIPNLMYYLHGIFEFGLNWGRSDAQIHSYGLQHFAPFAKALAIFTGERGITEFIGQRFYYREGVWTSFFGPLWVDFGWFAFLAIFLFGMIVKWVAIQARDGGVNFLPLHIYLAIVVFFMPVLNLIVSAQGMYVITAFAIFALVTQAKTQQKSASVPVSFEKGERPKLL